LRRPAHDPARDTVSWPGRSPKLVGVPVPVVFALHGVVRDYSWGSTTAIQRLLGTEPDGRPAAELWLGAHPGAPSAVADTGATLDMLIADDPEALLGQPVLARFGPRLPFLLKVLAAGSALSLQVHPTRAQARAGFAAEEAAGLRLGTPERNYPDDNHKPELLVALTDFDALCGFRPVPDTLRLLADWRVPELAAVAELLAGSDGLRAAFSHLLTVAEPAPMVRAVTARAAAPDLESGEWAVAARSVRLCAEDFPGDRGVVLGLLLNAVRLAPGEAIYLGAGTPHAYLRGTAVEAMANSDNVLRCGLTAKHIDVPELLKVADFRELADPRWPVRYNGFGADLAVPVEDFRLSLIDLEGYRKPDRDAGSCAFGLPGPCIVLCLDGAARVEAGGARVELAPGRAAFVCAREGAFTVRGRGRVVVATDGMEQT
jgi:mannose-6-phosphate isomerase